METSEVPQVISPEAQIDTAKEIVSKLPQELKSVVSGYIEQTAKAVLAQQTSPSGETFEVRATPDQVAFYERRFQELHELGVLNPHDQNSSKKLSFSE